MTHENFPELITQVGLGGVRGGGRVGSGLAGWVGADRFGVVHGAAVQLSHCGDCTNKPKPNEPATIYTHKQARQDPDREGEFDKLRPEKLWWVLVRGLLGGWLVPLD